MSIVQWSWANLWHSNELAFYPWKHEEEQLTLFVLTSQNIQWDCLPVKPFASARPSSNRPFCMEGVNKKNHKYMRKLTEMNMRNAKCLHTNHLKWTTFLLARTFYYFVERCKWYTFVGLLNLQSRHLMGNKASIL